MDLVSRLREVADFNDDDLEHQATMREAADALEALLEAVGPFVQRVPARVLKDREEWADDYLVARAGIEIGHFRALAQAVQSIKKVV